MLDSLAALQVKGAQQSKISKQLFAVFFIFTSGKAQTTKFCWEKVAISIFFAVSFALSCVVPFRASKERRRNNPNWSE